MLHVLAATTRAVTEDVVFDGVLLVMVVAFLLFLAGLELDFEIIRGRPVNLGLRAFALSVALGILVTLPLGLSNVIADPLFIGIVLTATSLGIVIPVLKDAAQLDTGFGHFVVRGAPALLFRKDISRSQVFASALMQSTSLSFIVVATTLGVTIGEVRPINAASLVAAGMLSVLVFPATALALLRKEEGRASLGSTR